MNSQEPSPERKKEVEAAKLSRRRLLQGIAGTAGVLGIEHATGQRIQTAAAQELDPFAAAQDEYSYPKGDPAKPFAPYDTTDPWVEHGRPQAPDDPTAIPGAAPTPHSERSPFDRTRRVTNIYEKTAQTPLENLHGLITPADLHFERNHNGVPTIDPERYEILIHGMVERPMKFNLEQLMRFPAVSRIMFLECGGNWWLGAPRETQPSKIAGLTSQSEWTGVMLSTLLREVGVKPGAKWFLAEGGDAARMTRSIPTEKGMDDTMIAYAQNGAPLRQGNGYPARLITPGYEGSTNVKWLRRLEFSDMPFMSREETVEYTEPLNTGKIRHFSFELDARSVITFPTYPVTIEKGWVEIRGIAWSGRGKGIIKRVDISTDGGRNWRPAELQAPVLPMAHTRFRCLWKWNGQRTEIMSRAIDDTGYVQPTVPELMINRGVGSINYHANPIMTWTVEKNGEVYYREEN
jgi:sulfane dehydrogenase subunit SoxC